MNINTLFIDQIYKITYDNIDEPEAKIPLDFVIKLSFEH